MSLSSPEEKEEDEEEDDSESEGEESEGIEIVGDNSDIKKGKYVINQELSEDERIELWISKLKQMRKKHLASMTELERESFIKNLNLLL